MRHLTQATSPPVADTVTVQATSSNPNAILSVWFLPGNFAAFELKNTGGGHYSELRPTTAPSVPPQIFVQSNFGGVSPTFNLCVSGC